jgi:hypothetical protein
LVERFINAKVLELSRDHALGDQIVVEALFRFSDEELKHQALFRRIDAMVGEVLPGGYRFDFRLTIARASTPTPSCPSCSRMYSSITGRRNVSMRSSTSSSSDGMTPR